MMLITWPKHALEESMSRYVSPIAAIVLILVGIVVSIVEILIAQLWLHSTALLVLFWLGVVITGWLSDHYDVTPVRIYTFGAWLTYVVFIVFSILSAIFH